MRRLHLVVGLVTVVIFLYTGRLMRTHEPPMPQLADGTRMLYRSRHIYLLGAGLVNLAIGAYFHRAAGWRRHLQLAASVLIWAAPVLALAAFFTEPAGGMNDRRYTLPTLISLLTGCLLHALAAEHQESA